MKKSVNVFSNVLFFLVGVGILIYLFKKQDVNAILLKLSEVNWSVLPWVVLAILIGHVVRAFRMHLLYKGTDNPASLSTVFIAMMTGYMINFGVPRLGEIVRCAIPKQREDVPFTTSLGIVLIERLVDLLSLFLFFGIALFAHYQELISLFDTYVIGLFREKMNEPKSLFVPVLVVVGLLFGLYYLMTGSLKKESGGDADAAIDNLFDQLKGGLVSIAKTNKIGLFVLYSVVIWLMYFAVHYICFFTIKETSSLGLSVAVAVTAMGMLGRSVPIQGGGMGAFHFIVMKTLTLFGVASVAGTALAIVIHGVQAIFQIVIGSICGLIYLIENHLKATRKTI